MSPDPGIALYSLKLTLPADLDDARIGSIASRLEEHAMAVSMARANQRHDREWNIVWLFSFAPDVKEMAALLDVPADELFLEDLEQMNWLEHCYQQFQPFSIGAFFIYGSHYDGPLPAGQHPLQIDAATAFGSGEHGTTKGCLLALLALQEQGFAPKSVLDMGTGSGILLIGARRLWDCYGLGVDIDDEAVRVAARHAGMNGVTDNVDWVCGNGFATPDVAEKGPFDLSIANILAGPLVSMAEPLSAATVPGGHIILSGLLTAQADEVLEAYTARGAALQRRFDHDGWVALLLRKSA